VQLNLHMSWYAIAAFLVLCAAAVCANVISWLMIGMINAKVSEDEQISYFWWGGEVRPRFKRLFPGHRFVFMLDACVVIMVLSFFALAKLWVLS